MLDREENWFERGVKEAVWVRTKNPSLDCNCCTGFTLSHTWHRSINVLHTLSTFFDSFGSKISTMKPTNVM